VADDSFRLLSFTLHWRPFRYTTGNRQRLRLVRVKSDYGTSGITSSFSKDTILPRLWSRNSWEILVFSPITIRHPSVYMTFDVCCFYTW